MNTSTLTRTALGTALAAAALGGSLALAAGASASGGGGVRTSGTCSSGATWTLKAKHGDNLIQVEAEVDANRTGQTWRWSIADNGTVVRTGTSTTAGPSGSFSVERRIADKAGADRLVLRAVRPATGQTCTGSVTA